MSTSGLKPEEYTDSKIYCKPSSVIGKPLNYFIDPKYEDTYIEFENAYAFIRSPKSSVLQPGYIIEGKKDYKDFIVLLDSYDLIEND